MLIPSQHTWLPAKPIAASLPKTCTHTCVSASHCVGLTLPGMMLEPGSLEGMESSWKPQRGPDADHRTSLAIFISEPARRFKAPLISTTASCADSASNLLGAVTKGSPVSAAMFCATRSAHSGCVLRPVPTAVPPIAISQMCGSAFLTATSPWSSWLT